jgi:hypothetical protein
MLMKKRLLGFDMLIGKPIKKMNDKIVTNPEGK